jgi:predicted nucleic acid-binding protein
MLVVADSSPLHYLILIEAIQVLLALYAQVIAPPIVLEELSHPRTPPAVRAWIAQPPVWLAVRQPQAVDDTLVNLGAGETQAILLAQELRADVVLIDEEDGRRAAQQRALTVMGTLGVLARAAAQGLQDLPAALTRLRATNFRMTEHMIEQLLTRDAARKRLPRGDDRA